MIEDKELGVKIAENTDEAFWTETKEKCETALKVDARNKKINEKMKELCEAELETFK